MKNPATTVLPTLVLCCLLGCGSDLDLVPLSGQVLVDGKPYGNAKVIAYPENGPSGFAKTDAQGEFHLSTAGEPGVAVGMYTMTVTPDVGESVPDPNKPVQMLVVPYDSTFRSTGIPACQWLVGAEGRQECLPYFRFLPSDDGSDFFPTGDDNSPTTFSNPRTTRAVRSKSILSIVSCAVW